mgnify:CR=1 FL=1
MTVFFHYSIHGFANVYLVGNDETNDALIVDPASITLPLLEFIETRKFNISAVLLTHNHAHHLDGLRTLRRIYDVEVYSSNSTILGEPCRMIADGELFTVCGLEAQALSVPGHAPDSLVYRFGKILFTGDTLHAGTIGKTMSQYGNRLLREQLERKVLSQSDDCIVLPGHGPPSSIGAEKQFNVGLRDQNAERKKSHPYLYT